MVDSLDASTRDLSQLRLKLADHLTFAPNRYGKKIYFQLEDPAQSQYFRLGYSEYVFVSLLDGTVTVREALAATAKVLGRDALSDAGATAICNWLVQHGLVQTSGVSISPGRLNTAKPTKSSVLQSLFWTRIPLCQPDQVLQRLIPFVGWIYSPVVGVVWLLILVYAAASVFSQWDRVVASSSHVLNPSSWYGLAAAWGLLKIFHELSHGLACRRFGGRVGPMGVVLILLAPLAYIDVSASWQLRSKWRRIAVAGAGIYMDCWMTALAALCWVQTRSVVYSSFLYDLVMMGAISLIFNGNPIIRSDSYYILADLLEMPNLADRSTANLKSVCLRWLFGIRATEPNEVSWRHTFSLAYAVCALIWRLIVCGSLILAFTYMWHGAGLIVALIGLFCWVLRPLMQFLLFLLTLARNHVAAFTRGLAVLSALTVTILALLNWVPWPAAFQSPGIVEFSDLARIRADAPGFIRILHVQDGQAVRAGDLLIELHNDELELECRDLEIAIQQSEAKGRVAKNSAQIGTAQVEEQNQKALAEQLAEKVRQLALLKIHAPRDGRVIGRGLASSIGSFAKEGTVLLEIGSENDKELQIAISQDNLSAFEEQQAVEVRLADGSRFQSTIKNLSPRSSDQPLHPALCAPYGGPITVIERATPIDREKPETDYYFSEPHVSGTCAVSRSISRDLKAGTIAYVSPISRQKTIGEVLLTKISALLDNRQ